MAAEERGERVIAHPEVNVIFDGGAQLYQNVDQDSPLFTPHFLYVAQLLRHAVPDAT